MLRIARAVRLDLRRPTARSISGGSGYYTFPVFHNPGFPFQDSKADFHPVTEGELFNGRYEALRALGQGFYSTVWLVRDIRTQEEAAMKVLTASLTEDKGGSDELGIMKVLGGDTTGNQHVCRLLDSFCHDGPAGKHICLVMERLGMSALDLYYAFNGISGLPMMVVQRMAKHILHALQHTHACGVIHTDIKGDNILLTDIMFPEGQHMVDVELHHLMFKATYKLADFGCAHKMSHRRADSEVPQPVALRAPEVLIGAPWDTKADIWNFGCLIYEFVRGGILFDPIWLETGMDRTETHLAKIAGLVELGAFPSTLLAKGQKTTDYFDKNGNLLKPLEGGYTTTFTDLLSRADWHVPGELGPFVDFLNKALTIDPEVRWSAAQLLAHPWIQNV
ncbi:kinase-like domain-containing protein [Mycena filopes]|nr:kinase-like domain-containing protein [Mycena filopes]